MLEDSFYSAHGYNRENESKSLFGLAVVLSCADRQTGYAVGNIDGKRGFLANGKDT